MNAVTTPTGRFYTPDERPDLKLPSVTTIIGSMSDKSGLDKWRKSVGEEAADRISKFAANRGTFMHLLCENYLRKRYEEKRGDTREVMKETFAETMADEDISSMDRMMLIAGKNLFMNLYRDSIFDSISGVVIQEVGLWSENGGGYAGRVDLIAKLVDDTLVVIDFKSSTRPKNEKYLEGYKMQTAAYAFAYNERYGKMPQKGQVWISNEANEIPQIFELDLEGLNHYHAKFIEMVKGYHEQLLR